MSAIVHGSIVAEKRGSAEADPRHCIEINLVFILNCSFFDVIQRNLRFIVYFLCRSQLIIYLVDSMMQSLELNALGLLSFHSQFAFEYFQSFLQFSKLIFLYFFLTKHFKNSNLFNGSVYFN